MRVPVGDQGCVLGGMLCQFKDDAISCLEGLELRYETHKMTR